MSSQISTSVCYPQVDDSLGILAMTPSYPELPASNTTSLYYYPDLTPYLTAKQDINKMPNVLIVGATRGLGAELAQHYAKAEYSVYGTARSSSPPKGHHHDIHWITGIDIAEETAAQTLVQGLEGHKLDLVILTAGFFPKETFESPYWEAELQTYKICSIGPLFVVQRLWKAGLLKQGAKVVLVSSEAGSIALRHESEGGAMYAHHGSKAALNMVGKLLSLNLKGDGVAVGMVHPGFMRTEMTKGVGFDKVCLSHCGFTVPVCRNERVLIDLSAVLG